MRQLTDEEMEIIRRVGELEKLDPEETAEEREKLIKRLKEINIEETVGHLWLT